ncbi:MAG: hypothetical protein ACT4TC_05400 [Myxococcaceae bacterium]
MKPYLTRIAPRLALEDGGVPALTVVYQGLGTCSAVGAVRRDGGAYRAVYTVKLASLRGLPGEGGRAR